MAARVAGTLDFPPLKGLPELQLWGIMRLRQEASMRNPSVPHTLNEATSPRSPLKVLPSQIVFLSALGNYPRTYREGEG